MRVTLPESGRKRSRTLGGIAISTLFHAAIISAVVLSTGYGAEHAAARPGNPPPRYPDVLRTAGVEGTVHAQFVVDTTGRVERESIRFKRGDHQLFERAVTETLLRSRYRPAEAGGRKVRQLVEQAFSFALGRSL